MIANWKLSVLHISNSNMLASTQSTGHSSQAEPSSCETETVANPRKQTRPFKFIQTQIHAYSLYIYAPQYTVHELSSGTCKHINTHTDTHIHPHTKTNTVRQQLHLCDAAKTNCKIWSVAAASSGRWQVAGSRWQVADGSRSQAKPTSATVAE